VTEVYHSRGEIVMISVYTRVVVGKSVSFILLGIFPCLVHFGTVGERDINRPYDYCSLPSSFSK